MKKIKTHTKVLTGDNVDNDNFTRFPCIGDTLTIDVKSSWYKNGCSFATDLANVKVDIVGARRIAECLYEFDIDAPFEVSWDVPKTKKVQVKTLRLNINGIEQSGSGKWEIDDFTDDVTFSISKPAQVKWDKGSC